MQRASAILARKIGKKARGNQLLRLAELTLSSETKAREPHYAHLKHLSALSAEEVVCDNMRQLDV